jgi:hypothetical protein
LSYTADEEEEHEGPGLVEISRWSWLAYLGSAVNLARCFAGNLSGHLEDMTTMIAAEVRRREQIHEFHEEARADLERLPVAKE